MQLILLVLIQCLLLSGGQLLLKKAMVALPDFSWTGTYLVSVLTDWWLLGAGLLLTGAGLLWAYLLRHYPFSLVYPLSSLSYAIGIGLAVLILHEQVSWTQCIGILLIMAGCYLMVK